MKNPKKSPDFKIEELEQRLEMDAEWKANENMEPTASDGISWESVLIGVAVFVLFIILI